MKRLYCSTSRSSYVTAQKSLRTDSPRLSHSSQWNGGHETSFPPPTLPLALMARPFAASQPHCYAQDPNFCPKRDLTPTHVSGPFVAFHLAPTLDRREEKQARPWNSLRASTSSSGSRPILFRRALLGPVEPLFSSSTFPSRSRPFGAPQSRPNIRTSYLTAPSGFCLKAQSSTSVRGGQLTVPKPNGAGQSGPFFVLQRQDTAKVRGCQSRHGRPRQANRWKS